MKAYVISEPGGPAKLILKDVSKPTVKTGWVLIKVKAIGLNHSEVYTRLGQSPSVKFPRILGIECVGEIAESLNPKFQKGQIVAAIMGGMGREFDGSYAEFVLVPEKIVFPIKTHLNWEDLAALPEMIQTTHGSLYQGLEIKPEQTLLIRGGTSSIGLCALEMAKNAGLNVISTTRTPTKIDFLLKAGAKDVIVDNGEIYDEVMKKYPQGIDRVLELVGTTTLLDSLKILKRGGIACMTGGLGGGWELKNFSPMGDIPTAVKLTCYMGEVEDLTTELLQEYIERVEHGEMKVSIAKIFSFAELPDAHRLMDSNQSNGKIVVVM